jgi:integrase
LTSKSWTSGCRQRKIEIAEGRYLDIKQDNKIAFTELAKRYLQLPEVKRKRSYYREELSVRTSISFCGDRKLNTITHALIENNPAKFVQMCEENNVSNRVLSKDEFERLLSYVPDFIRDIILVVYYTAIRIGKILNLQWSRVDLKA